MALEEGGKVDAAVGTLVVIGNSVGSGVGRSVMGCNKYTKNDDI